MPTVVFGGDDDGMKGCYKAIFIYWLVGSLKFGGLLLMVEAVVMVGGSSIVPPDRDAVEIEERIEPEPSDLTLWQRVRRARM